MKKKVDVFSFRALRSLDNLRKIRPHLRHGEMNTKCRGYVNQIGSVLLRRTRHSEIPPSRFPEGSFALAEKLDDFHRTTPTRWVIQFVFYHTEYVLKHWRVYLYYNSIINIHV